MSRTIVLADDEPIIRLDIRKCLEEQGYQVCAEASDGFDAVEACRSTHPDAALIDLKMPVFDGLYATEAIIQERLAGCVVIMTAYADSSFEQSAACAGAAGYLVKPVHPGQLGPAIEIACSQGEILRREHAEKERLQKKLEDNRLIDRAVTLFAGAQGIPEQEARRRIQKTAMDKRCPAVEIARGLIRRYDTRDDILVVKQWLMRQKGMSEAAAYRWLCRTAKAGGQTPEEAARQIRKRGGLS